MNKISSFSSKPNVRKPLDGFTSANAYDVSSRIRTIPHNGLQETGIDESSLVQSARQGDLQAFNRLVLAYQDRAFTLACYLLSDQMAAEDIVQEAFITSYRALSDFRGGSFQSWLLRIVKNMCIDELRRRKNHHSISFELIDSREEEVESPFWSVDSGETPEESLICAETSRQIIYCLDQLKIEYRTVIVLIDILDMHYREVAKILGCPTGTIKSRLARARLQMQRLLCDHLDVAYR